MEKQINSFLWTLCAGQQEQLSPAKGVLVTLKTLAAGRWALRDLSLLGSNTRDSAAPHPGAPSKDGRS